MIRLWTLLNQPGKLHFYLALLFAALSGGFGIFLLGLSGWFLTAASLAGLAGAGYVFNHLYPSGGIRASAFGRVITRYADQLVGHDATLRLSAMLRPRLFAAGAASQRGFTPMSAGELSALTDEVDAAEAGFLKVISPAAALMASLAVALGFTFGADWLSGVILLLALFGGLLPLSLMTMKQNARAAQLEKTNAELTRQVASGLVENAVELDVINGLTRASDQTRSLLSEWSSSMVQAGAAFRRLAAIVRLVGLALALFVLWRAIAGPADLALAAGAGLALMACFDALAAAVSLLAAAKRANLAANHLADRVERDDADWNPSLERAAELSGVFPVQAENLIAQAAETAPKTPPVSFDLHAGECLQIIGRSGTGKTTLAETLMRLQPLAGGVLHYAGIPAEQTRIASILERMAIAPQFPAFLPGTLRDQMLMAKPDATDERIWQALETSHAATFLRERTNPLDTKFSDGAFPFSGGQLRRIAIARALLACPDILVLDEPFAGLEVSLAGELAKSLSSWVKEGERALILLSHEEIAILPQNLPVKYVILDGRHKDC